LLHPSPEPEKTGGSALTASDLLLYPPNKGGKPDIQEGNVRKVKDAFGKTLRLFGAPLPALPTEPAETNIPDWRQAKIQHINQVLERVKKLPSGGWYVIGATSCLGENPHFFTIDGHELCVWRDRGRTTAAINRCPHMGAPLSEGQIRDGILICPWHGLNITEGGQGKFIQTYDDGVLTWARFGASEAADRPILPLRPARHIAGVIQFTARCDPEDVIANRLDPWHGVHFHPHSFARLKVIDNRDDVLTVRVVFRAVGSIGVEVDCTFHCPEPNTIVMTIIRGEGEGSVVETHATPLRPGWTTVTEATLASSDRPVFRRAMRHPERIRRQIENRAKRLWADDRAYAERRYYLRHPELDACISEAGVNEPVGRPRPV
jgi:isorenieratene synthase